jgi:hypothetical protein
MRADEVGPNHPGDAIVISVAILTSHADDEFGDLRSDARTARITACREPLNFRATSLRNQARRVSVLAAEAPGCSSTSARTNGVPDQAPMVLAKIEPMATVAGVRHSQCVVPAPVPV